MLIAFCPTQVVALNLPDTPQNSPQSVPQPERIWQIDELSVSIYRSPEAVALAASAIASQTLRTAIQTKGKAAAIFATGRSQVQFLSHLTQPDNAIDWSKVTGFHLDEYLGIAANHPASFRQYLKTHLVSKVSFKQWHSLEGDGLLPLEICQNYAQKLRQDAIDLCCLGIGENGHLAFNDPAVADFDDPDWVKLVRLDERNRQQQAASSAFATLEAVPQYAFTLTIRAIRAAHQNLCIAFGANKAAIVKQMLSGPVSTDCPASILRKLPLTKLLIDEAAAQHLVGIKGSA